VSPMIAKTYVFAKTLGSYAMRILREAKSLRDHGGPLVRHVARQEIWRVRSTLATGS
jgi:hypothetical protein